MRRGCLLVLLVLAATWAGTVQGGVVSHERVYVFRAVDRVDGVTNASFTGEDARGIRESADADGDGHVNASEASEWERAVQQDLQRRSDPQTFVDGVKPGTVRIDAFGFRHLAGNVSSDATVGTRTVFALRWDDVRADRTIAFERRANEGDSGPWAIHAPPGYHVGEATGLTDVRLPEDRSVVRGNASAGTDIVVTFEDPDVQAASTPGPHLALVAAAVAGAAYVTRSGWP